MIIKFITKYPFIIALTLHLGFLSFLLFGIFNTGYERKINENVEILNAEIVGLVNQSTNISQDAKPKELDGRVEYKKMTDISEHMQEKKIEAPKIEVKSRSEELGKLLKKEEIISEEPLKEEVVKKIEVKKQEIKKPEVKKKEVKKDEDEISKKEIAALKKSFEKATQKMMLDSNVKKDQKKTGSGGGLPNGAQGDSSTAKLASYIRAKIVSEWEVAPLIGLEVQKVYAILRIRLDKFGNVTDINVINEGQYRYNDFFERIKESAISAVKRASPIEGLPIEQYSDWKEIELAFDPSRLQ